MELFCNDEDTLIVVSSDLSHYHSYDIAQRMDAETTAAIERMDTNDIGMDDACGRNPIKGLLSLAKEKHFHVETIDLRNSGDTAGPKDRVVGYGAYVIY
jgi:AmmeMemoRadiSam system protein B